MKSIDIRTEACTSCGRCLRKCEVKAIRMTAEGAAIDDALCINCGRCLRVCPHGAMMYFSDLSKVEGMLERKQRVVASISPELGYAYPDLNVRNLVGAMKQIGFMAVHEASEANAVQCELLAERANRMFQASLARTDREGLHQTNIIIPECPAVVNWIEQYYPELIPQLAPIAPNGIAHGRYLKSLYGADVKVVHFTSCVTMKHEADKAKNKGAVDAILTMKDLEKLFVYNKVDPAKCMPAAPDSPILGVDRLYPCAGTMIQSVEGNAKFPKGGYYTVSAYGINSVKRVLEDLKAGVYSKCMIGLRFCSEGCVSGPGKPVKSSPTRTSLRLKQNTPSSNTNEEQVRAFRQKMNSKTSFESRQAQLSVPTQEELDVIIRKMGLESRKHEPDCGACGYRYCYEHAIAIYQGRSSVDHCIQYLAKKAHSLANVVMANSPNLVMILDKDLVVQECSSISEHYFGVPKEEVIGHDLIEFMEEDDFEWAIKNRSSLKYKTIELVGYNKFVQQNITYLPESDSLLVILIDISEQKKLEEVQRQKNEEIVEMTQKIVDKQMMVAQTIAGLLGESTAETKLALIRLSKSLLEEKDGDL